MAYIQAENDPNQPTPNQSASPMAQLPQTATGTGAGAISSPQGAAAVPNATKAPPVQDLQAYLTANAPQAVQMGQNIAGGINQTAEKVTGDVNAAQDEFNQGIAANNVAPNPDLVSRAASAPAEFVKNPEDVTAFQAQQNANYSGPATFEETPQFSGLNSEVQSALSKAPDITKPGNIDQLARGQETNPTAGMSALDSLLLQENPEALAPISSAIPNIQALTPALTGTTTSADKAIQDAIANDQAAKAGIQNTFLTGPNAVAPAFNQKVNQELQGNVGKVNDYNKALDTLITQENEANPQLTGLSSAVKAYNDALATEAASTSPLIAGQVKGVNPLTLQEMTNPGYLSQPTLAQSATPEDIQTSKALQTLLGGNYTPSFDATGQTPFQAPTSPSIEAILGPILDNIAKQGVSENVRNAPGSLEGNTDYAMNVKNAINSLLQYLSKNAPPTTPTAPPVITTPPETGTGPIFRAS